MRVLVVTNLNICACLMASGWLKWLDPEIMVVVGSLHPVLVSDTRIEEVMQERSIDITGIPRCVVSDLPSTETWDFILWADGGRCYDRVSFPGTQNWLSLPLPDLSQSIEHDNAEYRLARDVIYDRIFEFYLRQLHGKEILGADSCGASCDW